MAQKNISTRKTLNISRKIFGKLEESRKRAERSIGGVKMSWDTFFAMKLSSIDGKVAK